MSTRGKAMRIIQQVEPGNGFEAWRRLRTTFEPSLGNRFAGMLQEILSPSFEGDFIDRLVSWENQITKHESQSKQRESVRAVSRAFGQHLLWMQPRVRMLTVHWHTLHTASRLARSHSSGGNPGSTPMVCWSIWALKASSLTHPGCLLEWLQGQVLRGHLSARSCA